jgi:uncharacterized protein YndB with AHSA1/START domain/DNA-binding MarR family transcriptional regulator
MDAETLLTLGEPNRLRIVELLHAAPRSVGEVALELGLRQPQATKHLQALERAGLAVAHALGRRKIYALVRERFAALSDELGELAREHPSEAVLTEYAEAIAREAARGTSDRVFRFSRWVGAEPEVVWRAWTTRSRIRRWWAPTHFRVTDCEVEARAGGVLRIALGEPDGTVHQSRGGFLAVHRPHQLTFELSPLDARGKPLFRTRHDLHLVESGGGTALDLVLVVDEVTSGAAPALGGIGPGWRQLLDNLEAELARA